MLYFAWVREAIGAGEEVVDAAGAASIGQLLDLLAEASEGHAQAFADRSRLRAAVDGLFVPLDAPVGAEVAIFPPVTGG
jgi:molybdopterin synthase sulfur carrier subunit